MDYKVKDLLNKQITNELESSYLYLSFANDFDKRGLEGFAHWYKVQAQEEIDHAMIFYDYLHKNDVVVTLNEVKPSHYHFDSILAYLEAGLTAEKNVTESINNIYKESESVNDYRTQDFLRWFIREQAEEESNADRLVDDLKIYGVSEGLLMLDKKYGKREYKKVEYKY